jgi:hypothetical protein
MATLLLNVFPGVKAVPHHGNNVLPKFPVNIQDVKVLTISNISSLSKTYAANMPDWVLAKYFDPEATTPPSRLPGNRESELEING